MNIFRKKTILAGEGDASHATDSIDALRASLSEGAAQQELAAKRLAGLSDAIARLDASRREAARLSEEKIRLEKSLKDTKTQFDAKSAWAAEQSAKLVTIKAERDQLRVDLDEARAARAKAVETLDTAQTNTAGQASEIAALRAQLTAQTERAELAELARTRAAESNAKHAAALKAKSLELTETTRAVEALSAQLSDKTAASETANAALRDLRGEHSASKEKLIEALNALQSAEYRLSSEAQAHSHAMARRADEITALRRQVEQLSAELRIQSGMGEQYGRDLSGLRAELGAERERSAALEVRLRDATGTESQQAGALAQAKIDYDQLAEKFSDAVRDIEALRKVNAMQRKTLERYAEVGGAAAPRSATSGEPVRPVRVITGGAA